MRVGDVMVTSVPTVSAAAPLREAAALLAEHEAKAVVVVDASGRPKGIVSEPVLARVLEEMSERGRIPLPQRRAPAGRSPAPSEAGSPDERGAVRQLAGVAGGSGPAAGPWATGRLRAAGQPGAAGRTGLRSHRWHPASRGGAGPLDDPPRAPSPAPAVPEAEPPHRLERLTDAADEA